MTLVPPDDAAIGADAPMPPVVPDPLNDIAADDSPSGVNPPLETPDPGIVGDVVAFITSWGTDNFVSNIAGWPTITVAGVVGPASSLAAVVAVGASNGITIQSR